MRIALSVVFLFLLPYSANSTSEYNVITWKGLDSKQWHMKRLHDWQRRDTLEWSARQKIAVGAGRGLRYLHEECRVGCIFHRDMRPNNILPLVRDFGLVRWQADGSKGVETRARPLIEEYAIDKLVDPRLGNCYSEHEVYCMLHAASSCIRRDPHSRPRMSQVLRTLESDMILDSSHMSTPRRIVREEKRGRKRGSGRKRKEEKREREREKRKEEGERRTCLLGMSGRRANQLESSHLE
ncbi:hypothetical protein LguiA_014916 [Lonicera macranthoides]